MKLYKYIGFDKGYWSQPLLEKKLYFSSVVDMRTVNDENEFDHSWDTDSSFFNYISDTFIKTYNEITTRTRTLCLSQELTSDCWKIFCPNGGICYEFDYEGNRKKSDITSDAVEYAATKSHNVPSYVINSVKHPFAKELLTKSSLLSSADKVKIIGIMRNQSFQNLLHKHINHEMTLIKLEKYRIEAEYRFIHLSEGFNGFDFETKLIESKLSFDDLGLSLVCIHSSDSSKVSEIDESKKLLIKEISFP